MLNANDFNSTKVFAEIAKEQSKDPYADSPFKTLKDLSSKKKGKYFERIYQEYMESKGVLVEKSFDEREYKSPSDFEQDVRMFISDWDKAGDPLSRVWMDEDINV
jgi:hypothetical protein